MWKKCGNGGMGWNLTIRRFGNVEECGNVMECNNGVGFGVWSLVLEFWSLGFDAWAWYLDFAAWNLVPGVWILEFTYAYQYFVFILHAKNHLS